MHIVISRATTKKRTKNNCEKVNIGIKMVYIYIEIFHTQKDSNGGKEVKDKDMKQNQ